MSGTTLGRRDLLLASGAVLVGAGAAARAEEKPPDAPGLPEGPA